MTNSTYKTPRKIRGEWFKATREDTIHLIRQHVAKKRTQDGKTPLVEQDRGVLAIYFVSVYYKLLLRLPDIRRYEPTWTPKAITMAQHAKDQTYLLAPYLNLLEYEPWESAE